MRNKPDKTSYFKKFLGTSWQQLHQDKNCMINIGFLKILSNLASLWLVEFFWSYTLICDIWTKPPKTANLLVH